jgi:hypothetical protein
MEFEGVAQASLFAGRVEADLGLRAELEEFLMGK